MSSSDGLLNPLEGVASGVPGDDISEPPIERSNGGASQGKGRGIDSSLSAKISTISFSMVFFVVIIHSKTNTLVETKGDLTIANQINSFIQSTISEGFARAAVPLYFAISGFLFFQGYVWQPAFFRKKFAGRLTSLVVPYLVWSGFWILAYYSLQSFPQTRPYCQTTIIRGMAPGEVIWTWLLDPIPVQNWYIRDLILICWLTPLLGPLLQKAPVPILLLFIVLWFLNVNFLPNVTVKLKLLNPEGLLFFSAGGVLALHGLVSRIKMPIFVPILWVVLCVVQALAARSPSLGSWAYPIGRLVILVGVWSVWGLYDRIGDDWPWSLAIRSFSTYGIFIFFAHVPLITFINKRLLSLVRSPWMYLATYFLGFLLTVVLCLIMGILLKRIVPWFYSLLTGGR
jgi:surface polysaccharide O-acyltransferase-like enzyme